MTALTATAAAVAPTPARRTGRVTFPGVLRSEWIKTLSLRSTRWSLVIAVALMIGTTALVAWSFEDPVTSVADLVTPGGYFAQLTLAVLGVLVITGEYSTGMIRSTFTAVPRRTPALLAKAIVLAVVAVVTGAVGVALSTLASMPWHDRLGIALDLGDAETLRMLAGMPLYLAGIALLGFAVGALLRSSAGALATVLALLLVIEQIVGAIPLAFFENLAPFLPATAGSRLIMPDETIAGLNESLAGVDLTAWQGYGVMLGWVMGLLVLATVLVRRRDA
jgi:ABC-2 type transport system permease protein